MAYSREGLYAFAPRGSRYVLCPHGCGDYTVTPREMGELGALPVHTCELCKERSQEPCVWTAGELATRAQADARSGYFDGLKRGSWSGKFRASIGGDGDNLETANAKREQRELDDRGTVLSTRSAGALNAKRKLRVHPELAKRIRALGEASGLSRNQILSMAFLATGKTGKTNNLSGGCAGSYSERTSQKGDEK